MGNQPTVERDASGTNETAKRSFAPPFSTLRAHAECEDEGREPGEARDQVLALRGA